MVREEVEKSQNGGNGLVVHGGLGMGENYADRQTCNFTHSYLNGLY